MSFFSCLGRTSNHTRHEEAAISTQSLVTSYQTIIDRIQRLSPLNLNVLNENELNDFKNSLKLEDLDVKLIRLKDGYLEESFTSIALTCSVISLSSLKIFPREFEQAVEEFPRYYKVLKTINEFIQHLSFTDSNNQSISSIEDLQKYIQPCGFCANKHLYFTSSLIKAPRETSVRLDRPFNWKMKNVKEGLVKKLFAHELFNQLSPHLLEKFQRAFSNH